MGASHYPSCCSDHAHHHPYLQLSGIRDQEKVLKEISKLQPGQFSEELFNVAHQSITKSIGSVFKDVSYGHGDYELMNDLKRDAFRFAAFKAANFSETLKKATPEEKDKLIKAFELQLETESNTASKAARSAKNWQRMERSAGTHSNMEYLSSRSADKREEHQKYYGMVLPMNHSFWNTGLPPNDYGCKCRNRQTDAPITEGKVDPIVLPKGIVGNAYKERQVFANDHSFYTNTSSTGRKRVMDYHDELANRIPYPEPSYKSKGKVQVHDLHDKADIAENYEGAKVLADNGISVKIRPHGHQAGVKYPEYEINGELSELKTSQGKGVSSLIRSAAKQKCKSIVFRMAKESPYATAKELAMKVNGVIKANYTKFNGFWIIDKEQKVTFWEIKKAANK